MTHTTTDSKLFKELESIRNNDLAAYLNLKQNISTVHQKILMEEAERDYLGLNYDGYLTYKVTPQEQSLFAEYLGIKSNDVEEIILFLKKGEFLAAFFLIEGGYIDHRVHLFDAEAIEDLCHSFRSCLIPIVAPVPEEWELPPLEDWAELPYEDCESEVMGHDF